MLKQGLGISSFLFLWACILSCEKSENNNQANANLRKVSELSALMRKMQKSCQQVKEGITQEQAFPDFRADFAALTTAEPTDENIKTPAFEAMAQHFLAQLNQLYTEELPKKEAYNALVASCIACHQQHCQGPIKTIEKLYLK